MQWDKKSIFEQRNWYKAYDYMLNTAKAQELVEPVVLELHRILMEGIEFGGVYRSVPVYIPDATHDFPLPESLPVAMKRFYDKLEMHHAVCGMPEGINPILLAAWVQAEFVNIHPFRDGNGRVARMLTEYELIRYGYDRGRVFIGTADRKTYYALLDNYHTTRDAVPFARFITKHMRTPITEMEPFQKKRVTLKSTFRENEPEL